MRNTLRLLVLLAVGCVDSTTQFRKSLPPLPPEIVATSRVIPNPGGVIDLVVSLTVTNRFATTIKVANDPACPFDVLIFPDSTGEPIGSATGTTFGCPGAKPMVDLRQNDTLVMSRVLHGDGLTRFATGTYGINYTLGFSSGTVGGWGGAIRIPLAPFP